MKKLEIQLGEHDPTSRVKSLAQSLERRRDSALSKQNAVKALEDCAILILENRLPKTCDHESLVGLLESALGKSLRSFDSATTIPVESTDGVITAASLSLVRGVILNLDSDGHLVSIDITPGKIKERDALLTIVGLGRDSKSDVAERHDDYLAGVKVDVSP